MSAFLRNLVLRAAGLAPALAPPPVGPVEAVEPELEEIEVGAPPEPRAAPAPHKAPPVERVSRSETPRVSEPAPEARVNAPAAHAPVRRVPERAAEPAAPPLGAKLTELTVPKAQQPEVKAARAEENRPHTNLAESGREGSEPSVSVPAGREESKPPAPVVVPVPRVERASQRVEQAAPPLLAAAPRSAARQIVFVDAPALPTEVFERVTEVVKERVREAPGPVEVHIGRIEIAAAAPPVPPAPPGKVPPRAPRGFAEHASERRYLRRRWY